MAGALAAGAQLHEQEALVSWRPTAGGGVRVTTAKAQYTARRLVLAAGAWLPQLVPALQVRPRLAATWTHVESCEQVVQTQQAGAHTAVPWVLSLVPAPQVTPRLAAEHASSHVEKKNSDVVMHLEQAGAYNGATDAAVRAVNASKHGVRESEHAMTSLHRRGMAAVREGASLPTAQKCGQQRCPAQRYAVHLLSSLSVLAGPLTAS